MATLYGYPDPAEQAAMLLDRVRVDAYARAIAAVVRPGDVVLDVGSGSGVLAMLAARAGARRVYAVERTGAIALVREHVAANRLTGVVEPIRADLAELDALPEPPRVVVSEMLGHFAPAEQSHKVYRLARRLASAGAVLIPRDYRLVFAAARPRGLAADLAALDDLHGLRLTAITDRLRHRVAWTRLAPDELLGPETAGATIASDAELPASFTGTAEVAVDGPVTAIAVSFVATLADGVELSSAVGSAATHWVQTVFPIEPALAARAGDLLAIELVPRIALDSGTWTWTVRGRDQVRVMDAMDAMAGERSDLLAQLGLRGHRPSAAPHRLQSWAAALGAAPPERVDVEAMADALLAALPGRFPDRAEARQEVLSLLRAVDKAG